MKYTIGNWARYLVIFTLLTGVGFHATRLIIGVEAWQSFFTPAIDSAFSIPILLGSVTMLLGWAAFDFRSRVEKGVVVFTFIYFTGSMPLHVQTWFTQDTSYIASFPLWYSILFIGYVTPLLWVWARLKVRQAPQVRPMAASTAKAALARRSS
jgi:hypothetical protein